MGAVAGEVLDEDVGAVWFEGDAVWVELLVPLLVKEKR